MLRLIIASSSTLLVATNLILALEEFAKPDKQLALSLSGEGSLGSYQAGFLYYILQAGKINKMQRAKVITGTSAGSLNAFLTITETCSQKLTPLEKSLFYQTWTQLGVKNLYIPSKTSRF